MPKNKTEDKDFLLGGQAVLEGVMMRSPHYYTIAVQRENGDIHLKRVHKPKITERNRFFGLPFVRGVMNLGQTMAIGMSALNYSAELFQDEEDARKGTTTKKKTGTDWAMVFTIIVAIALAFGLVVFLPLFLTDLVVSVAPVVKEPLYYNIVDGLFRIAFFLGYLLVVSLLPDIRRVFQYHGAEHKAVYASEKEKTVTVETSRAYSPYHPRCGTSFLLLVMLVSVAIFSLTPTHVAFWLKLLIRTPLIPVIAGVSYEVLRFSAKLQAKGVFSFLSAPGMLLQRLTALPPDDKQLNVAVVALNEARRLEEEYKGEAFPEEEEIILPADT